MNFKIKLTLIIFFLTICWSSAKNNKKYCTLKFINKYNKFVELRAEIADSAYKRSRGLMFRESLPKNQGMIFIFPGEKNRSFWMKNTYIPLSIAYVSKEGNINEIHNMKPLNTSITYPSSLPAKFAIEVNQNWFKKNNITKNCRMIFNGCIGK